MKVWVVFEYDYDDSNVCGIFHNECDAVQYVTDHKEKAKVEHYNVDLDIQEWEVK